MLSLLLAIRPKCKAFQSTAILRLPTPRDPPKSMTAARTIPSSVGLRTSRPSTPCASLAPIMVTEGGGGAAGEGVLFCCDGGGAFASFCAWDAAADNAARLTAINVNKDLARISSPEILDRTQRGRPTT